MYLHIVAGLTIALARLRLDNNDGFSKLSTALVSFRLNYDEVDPERLPDDDIVESTAALASFRLDTTEADPELVPEVDAAESIAAQDKLSLDTDESEPGLSTSMLSKDNSDASDYSQLVYDSPNPVIVNNMLLFPSKSSEWEAMVLTSPLEGEVLLEVIFAESSLSPLKPEQHNDKHEAEPFTIPTPDIHAQANEHSQLASDGPGSVSQPFLFLVYLSTYDKELEEVLAIISSSNTDTQVNEHTQLISDASCAVVINNMPSSTTTTSGHGTPKRPLQRLASRLLEVHIPMQSKGILSTSLMSNHRYWFLLIFLQYSHCHLRVTGCYRLWPPPSPELPLPNHTLVAS